MTPSASATALRPPWGAAKTSGALLGGSGALYLALVGYRWDYLSHFLVGAGISLVAAAGARALGRSPAGLGAGVAVLLFVGGAAGEQLWFGVLVFDWADVGAGALGACCVAAGLLGGADELRARPLLVAGVLAVTAGLAVRFGPGLGIDLLVDRLRR